MNCMSGTQMSNRQPEYPERGCRHVPILLPYGSLEMQAIYQDCVSSLQRIRFGQYSPPDAVKPFAGCSNHAPQDLTSADRHRPDGPDDAV